MFKNAAANKTGTGMRIAAVVAALACALVAAIGLSACQTSTQPNTTLSPQLESGTTIQDGTLTVGVNTSDSPYAGTNGNGDIVGLDVDVAAALADELGMKLQVVDVKTDGRSALENKEVDLVLDEISTNANQPSTLSYTNAYLNDGVSLYCLTENAPKSIKSVKVGKSEKVLAQANTGAAYVVQETLGAKRVQKCDTLQEAFDALESGEQTYLVANAVIGDYIARNYSDIQRVDFLSSASVTPVYGMLLSDDAELATGVEQALETISQNGVLRVVASKWLGTQSEDLLPGSVDLSNLPETAFGSK